MRTRRNAPFAKDVAAVHDDFINLLEHIPGTKQGKQSVFASRGILVPRTTYEAMWAALSGRLGLGGAGAAVFELLRANTPPRVAALLSQAASGHRGDVNASDPAIVDDLFFRNGQPRKIGKLCLEHIKGWHDELAEPKPGHPGTLRRGRPYDIALSFAGEDRPYVEQVAHELKAIGLRVFYDAFETVRLLGKDLTAHLADVYKNQAHYCAMFLSRHYVRKAWPQFERQHAQARALAEKAEYILPIRLDDSEVPGLASTIGYVEARHRTPQAIAAILSQKMRRR